MDKKIEKPYNIRQDLPAYYSEIDGHELSYYWELFCIDYMYLPIVPTKDVELPGYVDWYLHPKDATWVQMIEFYRYITYWYNEDDPLEEWEEIIYNFETNEFDIIKGDGKKRLLTVYHKKATAYKILHLLNDGRYPETLHDIFQIEHGYYGAGLSFFDYSNQGMDDDMGIGDDSSFFDSHIKDNIDQFLPEDRIQDMYE